MQLKKIKEILQDNLIVSGLTEANEMQKETFSTIKSGSDCVIIAPEGSGKTTTIVINVIQKLAGESEESPRALVFVETKEKVIEMVDLFNKYAKGTELEIYGIHEKGDTDYDKNYISTGVDILVGTPKKLSDMFSSAGYNVNRLKMFIIDDADALLKMRHEIKIMRISDGVAKTQRIVFSDVFTERIEILVDKMLVEPIEFDFEEYEEENFKEEEDENGEGEDEQEEE
jgi:ATP-dependent RNA helicase RhlE